MADFYSSREAWNYQEKMHRYVIARWGYSRALFLWFVVDEIHGTDGWYHDRDAAEKWCRKMHEYLKTHDPYGRPTTGAQSGGMKQWWPNGYEIFDIAAREIYEVRLYLTWRGKYMDKQTLDCREGNLTVRIPELTTTRGHAKHVGRDVAFKIVPLDREDLD